jgi:hypothetical protein
MIVNFALSKLPAGILGLFLEASKEMKPPSEFSQRMVGALSDETIRRAKVAAGEDTDPTPALVLPLMDGERIRTIAANLVRSALALGRSVAAANDADWEAQVEIGVEFLAAVADALQRQDELQTAAKGICQLKNHQLTAWVAISSILSNVRSSVQKY